MGASPSRRIAVIGGGISGLAAAHRLVELDPTADVTLLEAGHGWAACCETAVHNGYLIEQSADNFITNVPWAVDLCRRLGGRELHPDERSALGRRSSSTAAGWQRCRRAFC